MQKEEYRVGLLFVLLNLTLNIVCSLSEWLAFSMQIFYGVVIVSQ